MGESQTTVCEGGITNLRRNDNGAMLIMGVFMATFVVAMLYYVAGVGETIVYRERMQDAADSGAMAGAIFLARGMNLVVMMNVTLASVFAVLVSAWTAFFLILSAAGLAAAECDPPWVWKGCIPAICLIISLAPACGKISDAEDIVSDTASATRSISRSARTVVPLAAIAVVAQNSADHFSPPVDLGVGYLGTNLPPRLPIEDDPDPPVCNYTSYPWGGYNGSIPSYLLNIEHARELAVDTAICGDSYVNEAALSGLGWELLSCLIAESEVKNKPQRVTNGENLGGDVFQFRTLMTGTPPYGTGSDNDNDKRVSIASWGRRDDAANIWTSLEPLTRMAFAQSEFYWDKEADREEWMWRFKWRARLRRFRPTSQFCSSGIGSRICGGVAATVIH